MVVCSLVSYEGSTAFILDPGVQEECPPNFPAVEVHNMT